VWARRQERDLRHGAGWVELPFASAEQGPNAGHEPGSHWVFRPTHSYCHADTNKRRRHPLHGRERDFSMDQRWNRTLSFTFS